MEITVRMATVSSIKFNQNYLQNIYCFAVIRFSLFRMLNLTFISHVQCSHKYIRTSALSPFTDHLTRWKFLAHKIIYFKLVIRKSPLSGTTVNLTLSFLFPRHSHPLESIFVRSIVTLFQSPIAACFFQVCRGRCGRKLEDGSLTEGLYPRNLMYT